MSFTLVAATWILATVMQSTVQAIDETVLSRAIEAYALATESQDRNERLQRFSLAEQLFRQAIETQRNSGATANLELLVNLGNAALQSEQIGKAIVAYREALALSPGHGQAQQNLQFARSRLPENFRMSQTAHLIDTLFFWRSFLAAETIVLLCAASFLLSAVLLSIGILRRSTSWRGLAVLPALVWVVLLASLLVRNSGPAAEAVITVDGTVLHTADSENSSPRLAEPLPDGVEVEVLEERERWTEVRVAGRTGWVRASSLARLEH